MENEIGERMNVLEKLYTLKVECVIEGMRAENKMREIKGESLAYGEKEFATIAEEIQEAMKNIASEYKRMKRRKCTKGVAE